MQRLLPIFLALLPAAAFSGPAEVPDLLEPLSQAEAIEVRQNNEAWLGEHLKYARRHRLVRVDADVLLSGERVRVVLFDGRSILFELLEREVHGSETAPYRFEWSGRVADSPITAEELLAMNPHIGPLEHAKVLYDAMFGISMRGSLYLRDVTTGGSWPVPHDHIGDDCECQRPEPVPGTVPFYTIRADFNDVRSPFSYRLRPLEHDPRYHVLAEIDLTSYPRPKITL